MALDRTALTETVQDQAETIATLQGASTGWKAASGTLRAVGGTVVTPPALAAE